MKRIKILIAVYLVFSFNSAVLFAGQTDPGEGGSETGASSPYHLVKADPAIYQATIYKIYIVANDSTEVTLYENTSGNTIDMTTGDFSSLATGVDITPATYTQAKIITGRTFGLKGYAYYDVAGGTRYYFYTKNGTSQEDIGYLQSDSWTEQSDYGTQTATMDDPGEGTEETTYNGNPAFIYTSAINLTTTETTEGTVRVKILVNNALELNDDTTDIAEHTAENPATLEQVNSITFSAPELEVQII